MLDFYKGKRVLVTGHTGFKGSWLAKILAMAGAEVYGYALSPNGDGVMQKCELCLENAGGQPACVIGCPNKAIVYEERGAVE